MDSAVLELRQVSREYEGGTIQAVRDVSLNVKAGEWLTIVGPSGSGKTTLLNLMGGLELPNRGDIFFEGRIPRSAAQWTAIRLRRIGFIFQAFHLLATLTAVENVQVPMFGVVGRSAERRERALKLLSSVGLDHRANQLPGKLSGGERQRVAIARSLANSPSVIFADEPTGNLDSKSAAQIMDLLARIHSEQKITVVLVTHNPSLVKCGNRLVTFIDGHIDAEVRQGEE